MSGEPPRSGATSVDATPPQPVDGTPPAHERDPDPAHPAEERGATGAHPAHDSGAAGGHAAHSPHADGTYPAYPGQQQPGPGGTYPAYPAYPAYPPGYRPAQPDRLTRIVTRVHARTPRWLAPLAVFGCVAAAAGYVLWADPAAADADAQPTCIVKFLTGFDCPGCGGTRAVWFMMHGDIPSAARHHAVLLFAVPFVAYLYVAWAGRALFGWRLPSWEPSSRSLIWFLAAWGGFSVLRYLPWAPFTWFFV